MFFQVFPMTANFKMEMELFQAPYKSHWSPSGIMCAKTVSDAVI